MVFGTFGECNTNAKEVLEMAVGVEYGVEHLGRTMAATTTVDAVRTTLRRRYRTHLSTTAWKGYANLILHRAKYVGTERMRPNKAQVRAERQARADEGELAEIWMAHETVVLIRDAFPNGWGECGGDALD